MPEKGVAVVIPALNEEETLAQVIDEIPREYLEGKGYRVDVLVVDNDSTDGTGEVAKKNGARVVHEPTRGKGKAISTGLGAVRADFVFILDGDFTYPATHIPEMLESLENGFDVVTGSRLKGWMEDGAMSRLNRIGNRLLALLAGVLYGVRTSDLCTGCWGFRGEVVRELSFNAVGFELEAIMFIEATRKGCRIAEIPIVYRRRATPPKLKSLRDGLRIGRTLLRERLRGQ